MSSPFYATRTPLARLINFLPLSPPGVRRSCAHTFVNFVNSLHERLLLGSDRVVQFAGFQVKRPGQEEERARSARRSIFMFIMLLYTGIKIGLDLVWFIEATIGEVVAAPHAAISLFFFFFLWRTENSDTFVSILFSAKRRWLAVTRNDLVDLSDLEACYSDRRSDRTAFRASSAFEIQEKYLFSTL